MGQNLQEFIGMFMMVTSTSFIIMGFRFAIFKWCKQEE